ncbi:MAG: hypothetical protein KME29_07405 [Calothrix sp. FI2-JRJ7]|jgi:hypothetical protein|nr:hypothetical protein [Calothrix sp. FI2-JRJ7]
MIGKRIMLKRNKAATSNQTSLSLTSPRSPTLENPTRGFGIPDTMPASANQHSKQPDHQQLSKETFKQPSLGHDISRISMRPQAKLTESKPGNLEEQPLQTATQFKKDEAINRKSESSSDHSGDITIQMYRVYRSGSDTDANLTPKAKDLTGNKRGLSTFSDPHKAPIRITKAKIIETDNLKELKAVANGSGDNDSHVSIRPESNDKLLEWSQSQHDTPEGKEKYKHPFTEEVQEAIVGTYSDKPKKVDKQKK